MTEVHFFVNSKDAKKRETLIDLFIKERESRSGSRNPGNQRNTWSQARA